MRIAVIRLTERLNKGNAQGTPEFASKSKSRFWEPPANIRCSLKKEKNDDLELWLPAISLRFIRSLDTFFVTPSPDLERFVHMHFSSPLNSHFEAYLRIQGLLQHAYRIT